MNCEKLTFDTQIETPLDNEVRSGQAHGHKTSAPRKEPIEKGHDPKADETVDSGCSTELLLRENSKKQEQE